MTLERGSACGTPVSYHRKLQCNFLWYEPTGGCALAHREYVAVATALGASVLQAERYFYKYGQKKKGLDLLPEREENKS